MGKSATVTWAQAKGLLGVPAPVLHLWESVGLLERRSDMKQYRYTRESVERLLEYQERSAPDEGLAHGGRAGSRECLDAQPCDYYYARPYYTDDGTLVLPGATCAWHAELLEAIRGMFNDHAAPHLWCELLRRTRAALNQYHEAKFAAARSHYAAFEAEHGLDSPSYRDKMAAVVTAAMEGQDRAHADLDGEIAKLAARLGTN